MEVSAFSIYLIIINIVGFLLFIINTLLYKYTEDKQVDTGLTIISLLGGSLGIVLSIMIFDRKAVKGNMMSRVFVICIFVIQIIIFLIVKGHLADELTFAVGEYLNEHLALLIYLFVINFVTFVAFAIDKIAAIEHRSRIRIVTLLGLAFIGGSIGALIAIYVLRHKTQKDYFTVGVPLIILMQAVVLFYLMNAA